MNQIKYILENFDFDKVHRVMECLDWQWASTDGIPNHYQLIAEAERILKEVESGRACCIATGGFLAEKRDGILSLSFRVDDWEGEPDEYN